MRGKCMCFAYECAPGIISKLSDAFIWGEGVFAWVSCNVRAAVIEWTVPRADRGSHLSVSCPRSLRTLSTLSMRSPLPFGTLRSVMSSHLGLFQSERRQTGPHTGRQLQSSVSSPPRCTSRCTLYPTLSLSLSLSLTLSLSSSPCDILLKSCAIVAFALDSGH